MTKHKPTPPFTLISTKLTNHASAIFVSSLVKDRKGYHYEVTGASFHYDMRPIGDELTSNLQIHWHFQDKMGYALKGKIHDRFFGRLYPTEAAAEKQKRELSKLLSLNPDYDVSTFDPEARLEQEDV